VVNKISIEIQNNQLFIMKFRICALFHYTYWKRRCKTDCLMAVVRLYSWELWWTWCAPQNILISKIQLIHIIDSGDYWTLNFFLWKFSEDLLQSIELNSKLWESNLIVIYGLTKDWYNLQVIYKNTLY
jgi:hypothetical protein